MTIFTGRTVDGRTTRGTFGDPAIANGSAWQWLQQQQALGFTNWKQETVDDTPGANLTVTGPSVNFLTLTVPGTTGADTFSGGGVRQSPGFELVPDAAPDAATGTASPAAALLPLAIGLGLLWWLHSK